MRSLFMILSIMFFHFFKVFLALFIFMSLSGSFVTVAMEGCNKRYPLDKYFYNKLFCEIKEKERGE